MFVHTKVILETVSKTNDKPFSYCHYKLQTAFQSGFISNSAGHCEI